MASGKGTSAIYMTAPFIEGQGSVTAKGYVGHVHLISLTFSATSNLVKEVGADKSKSKKDAGQGRFSEFKMSKWLDDSSGALVARAAEGVQQDPTTFEIVICSSGTDGAKGKPVEYALYSLEDAVLTSYEISFASGEVSEEITVAYGSALVIYQPIDSKILKSAATKISYEVQR